MSSFHLHRLLVFVLTGLVISVIAFFLARARPKHLGPEGGTIGPSKPLTLIAIIAGLGIGGLALYAYIVLHADIAALVVGLCAIALAAGSGFSLTNLYDITWDDQGISGPTSMWSPPFGPRQIYLPWSEVTAIGPDFVAGEQGRIRWHWVYAGHRALTDAMMPADEA